MSDSISSRIFLVGCPRSGTTLLQSLLAAHPKIVSFPESHFFRLIQPRARWRRLLGLARPGIDDHLEKFYDQIDNGNTCVHPERLTYKLKEYVRIFVSTLDNIASAQEDVNYWLEKTPSHLHSIDLIERHVPSVQFIHLLRNGRDVVASMYEVTHQHPDEWDGARSIETCLSRWTNDIEISRRCAENYGHHVLRYKSITQNLRSTLKRLSSVLGITYEQTMIRDYQKKAANISMEPKKWQKYNTKSIEHKTGHKFDKLFDVKEKSYIEDVVSQYELDELVTL